MAAINTNPQDVLEIKSSSINKADLESFHNRLKLTARAHDFKHFEEIFQANNISNTDKGILFAMKDNNGDTLLHEIFRSINKTSDIQKLIEFVSYYMKNGAPTDIENKDKQTPLTLLNRQKKQHVISSKDCRILKAILRKKVDEENSQTTPPAIKKQKPDDTLLLYPSPNEEMPDFYEVKQDARTLYHKYNYQLKIIELMLLVWIIDEDDFYLAVNTATSTLFDDIVLIKKENDILTHKYFQTHKKLENRQIEINDLFNSSEKPLTKLGNDYSINKYFQSFKKIMDKATFNSAEFFLVTNVDFSNTVKNKRHVIKDNNCSLKLIYPAFVYKLTDEKIKNDYSEMYKQEGFAEFIKKFRIIVNLDDNVITELTYEALRELFKINEVDIYSACMEKEIRVTCKKLSKEGKFLQNKDRKELVESVRNSIETLHDTQFSKQHIDYLKGSHIEFKTDALLSDLYQPFKNTEKCSFIIITSCPKLTAAKLCQIYKELELKFSELWFLSSRNLKMDKNLITRYVNYPYSKYLAIQCEKGETVDTADLFPKASKEKKIIVIYHRDDFSNVSQEHIDDSLTSSDNLTENSKEQLQRHQELVNSRNLSLSQMLGECYVREFLTSQLGK